MNTVKSSATIKTSQSDMSFTWPKVPSELILSTNSKLFQANLDLVDNCYYSNQSTKSSVTIIDVNDNDHKIKPYNVTCLSYVKKALCLE